MDAVKFIEESKRMCKSFGNTCKGCPANVDDERCKFSIFLGDEAAKQVELLEEWSAAHPVKTRQSVFLEQYPEARIYDNGVLGICPAGISLSHRKDGGGCLYPRKECGECRREFWKQEVIDNG